MSAPLHDDALDALGDANRRAIVEILSGGGRSVQEIADRLPISRPAVSRHLRLLKEAGLVGDETDGRRRIYALRAEGVDAIRQYFAETWDVAIARLRLLSENTPPHPTRPRAMTPEPLVIEFELNVPPEQAFAVWTERCASWWPRSHTISGNPSAITFEPRVGGRIIERAGEAEHPWGTVLAWDPPHRLRYLWHLFFTPEEATEVEVEFADRGGRTAVRLEQRGWERLGEAGPPRRERTGQVWRGLAAALQAALVGVGPTDA